MKWLVGVLILWFGTWRCYIVVKQGDLAVACCGAIGQARCSEWHRSGQRQCLMGD